MHKKKQKIAQKQTHPRVDNKDLFLPATVTRAETQVTEVLYIISNIFVANGMYVALG
jgi:hypothetical protein